MRDLPHVAGRIFGTPLLIDARKLDAIVPAFLRRLNGDPDDVGDTPPRDPYDGDLDPRISDGVAVIPIIGTLVRRKTMLDAWSGLTSYADIANALDCALSDARIRAVLLQLDSFGGEAAGCFELCDRIYAARGSKPIWAVADVDALSAGYAILSQAERAFVAPSGSAGSIGAVAVHFEKSAYNEAIGYNYTVIRAGLRKAELNSYEPLTREAHEKVQGSLDRARAVFVKTVVRARPGLSKNGAMATEAQWYEADDALKLKLVDAIGTYEDVFKELARSVASSAEASPPAQSTAPPEETEDEGEEPPGDDPEPPENPDETARSAMETPTDTKNQPAAGAGNTTGTPPNGQVVDLDAVRGEGAAAKAAEHREIVELCMLSGKPQLAGEFIVAGKSVADVRKALIDANAKAAADTGEISNHQPTAAAVRVNAEQMWDHAFDRARAAHPKQQGARAH